MIDTWYELKAPGTSLPFMKKVKERDFLTRDGTYIKSQSSKYANSYQQRQMENFRLKEPASYLER